jgi:D-amino-acid dehydrogenase
MASPCTGALFLRVAVIGAGIVGVTTAYELAAQGHEVVVLERRSSVAAETSFANAGVVAPGYVTPWAAPGMPWKVFKGLFRRDAPVRFDGLGVLSQLPWLWRFWRACRKPVHLANRGAMQQLALLSRRRLTELTQRLGLEYEQASGYLVLLRTEPEFKAASAGIRLLRELGAAYEVVGPNRVHQIEPGLNRNAQLHAAIHLPQDGVGNCRQFAHLLKAEAHRLGARFRFETGVASLMPGTQPVLRLTNGLDIKVDAAVVCAGVDAVALLKPIGVKLPLKPVWGYSVTAPVNHIDGHASQAPRSGLMDERFKVAITRLGQRVRVAGSAEIGGDAGTMRMGTLNTLYRVLEDWFPGSAVLRDAQHWKGARPMLPDGPPVLGESGASGIWLNLGHGSSGWALSCGSAQVLAERLAGRDAGVDLARLSIWRWH